jgi:hypothetical protein
MSPAMLRLSSGHDKVPERSTAPRVSGLLRNPLWFLLVSSGVFKDVLVPLCTRGALYIHIKPFISVAGRQNLASGARHDFVAIFASPRLAFLPDLNYPFLPHLNLMYRWLCFHYVHLRFFTQVSKSSRRIL